MSHFVTPVGGGQLPRAVPSSRDPPSCNTSAPFVWSFRVPYLLDFLMNLTIYFVFHDKILTIGRIFWLDDSTASRGDPEGLCRHCLTPCGGDEPLRLLETT